MGTDAVVWPRNFHCIGRSPLEFMLGRREAGYGRNIGLKVPDRLRDTRYSAEWSQSHDDLSGDQSHGQTPWQTAS